MGKFNTKSEGVKPTEINFMGEMAFKMSDKEELVSTVMTTFLHDGGYYEKEKTILARITEKLNKVDPKFAAKLAIYARNEGNLRSVTHFIAAEIAKQVSGTDWGKRFYNRIVIRPDDMSEILSAYAAINKMDLKDIKKIPNSIKKGFKTALERLDAYQIDKYKMNKRSVSMIDLVRLFHPKGTQKNAEAYNRLINGKSLSDLYTSKILEKEMSKAGQNTKSATAQEKTEAKAEAISSVLENVSGMPVMNLLRNLRNIILYAPDKVDEACRQLRIEDKIYNSRLLPFRFATAYQEIENMKYEGSHTETKSSITFESEKASQMVDRKTFETLKLKVLDAIEDALQISCKNIHTLEGNTAILVDSSGSMYGYGSRGYSSRVSAFSDTTTCMIGDLFAAMFLHKQNDAYVGLFGDKLINVPINRSMKLIDFAHHLNVRGRECGGSTEKGIYEFFRNVVKEKKHIDNVIIFSDCQIGSGSSFTSWYGTTSEERGSYFHELFKEFRKINPMATVTVCNLRQYGGTSVFDKSQRINNIAGWSTSIFDCVKNNSFSGFKEMIAKIEAIEI